MRQLILLLLAFAVVSTSAGAETTFATWYGKGLPLMKNGMPFNPDDPHTVAAVTYPLGTILQVTYKEKSLEVVVSDGMPRNNLGRTIDFTRAGAEILGFRTQGVAKVSIEVLSLSSTKP